jgi:hypothetical protein
MMSTHRSVHTNATCSTLMLSGCSPPSVSEHVCVAGSLSIAVVAVWQEYPEENEPNKKHCSPMG